MRTTSPPELTPDAPAAPSTPPTLWRLRAALALFPFPLVAALLHHLGVLEPSGTGRKVLGAAAVVGSSLLARALVERRRRRHGQVVHDRPVAAAVVHTIVAAVALVPFTGLTITLTAAWILVMAVPLLWTVVADGSSAWRVARRFGAGLLAVAVCYGVAFVGLVVLLDLGGPGMLMDNDGTRTQSGPLGTVLTAAAPVAAHVAGFVVVAWATLLEGDAPPARQ